MSVISYFKTFWKSKTQLGKHGNSSCLDKWHFDSSCPHRCVWRLFYLCSVSFFQLLVNYVVLSLFCSSLLFILLFNVKWIKVPAFVYDFRYRNNPLLAKINRPNNSAIVRNLINMEYVAKNILKRER